MLFAVSLVASPQPFHIFFKTRPPPISRKAWDGVCSAVHAGQGGCRRFDRTGRASRPQRSVRLDRAAGATWIAERRAVVTAATGRYGRPAGAKSAPQLWIRYGSLAGGARLVLNDYSPEGDGNMA